MRKRIVALLLVAEHAAVVGAEPGVLTSLALSSQIEKVLRGARHGHSFIILQAMPIVHANVFVNLPKLEFILFIFERRTDRIKYHLLLRHIQLAVQLFLDPRANQIIIQLPFHLCVHHAARLRGHWLLSLELVRVARVR